MQSIRFRRILLAVNCHGWEDFPGHYRGADAASLLNAWTSLWHPAVIGVSDEIPTWSRADSLPDNGEACLIIVPECCLDQITESERNRLVDQGANITIAGPNRQEVLDRWKTDLRGLHWSTNSVPIEAEELTVTIDDFFALGYAYLQIQLLTRQLRYSSSLDEALFAERVLNSARAWCRGSANEAQAISGCFDLLIEERNRYYPTCASLIDYTLLTASTAGASLLKTLQADHVINLVCSGSTLRTVAEQRPESLSRLRQAIEGGSACLVGGDEQELPVNLASLVTVIGALLDGKQTWQELLERQPKVYGRHSFGLAASLPPVLLDCEFAGAVHATFDGGQIPNAGGHTVQWVGDQGKCLGALVATPLDASRADSFLNLAISIGESLDSGHSAAVVFAHWPGRVGDAYNDFVRSARFGDLFGKFLTLDDYFQNGPEGYPQTYAADEYGPPLPEQLISQEEPDPISRFIDYWHRHAHLASLTSLQAMIAAMEPGDDPSNGMASAIDLEALQRQVNSCLSHDRPEHIESAIESGLAAGLEQLAQRLDQSKTAKGTSRGGCTIVNPLSFPRRIRIDVEPGCDLVAPESQPSALHAHDKDRGVAVVDLPAMGFVRLAQGQATSGNRPTPPLAEGRRLRNEFFQVEIDQQTGGIRAIEFYNRRGNLLSQQVALRTADPRQSRSARSAGRYSQMVAQSVSIKSSSLAMAEIVSTGHLSDGEQRLAKFNQTTRVTRGSRRIEIDLELESIREVAGNPWQTYYAMRFAWHDEGSDLFTYLHESRHATSHNRILAPVVLEIVNPDSRVALLTCGLPFHRRVGYRRLDSLLIVEGERRRRFRMGIAVDATHPYAAGLDLMSPCLKTDMAGCPAAPQSAWLFHLSCKNVLPLKWSPVAAGPEAPHGGLRLLLKETEGRSAKLSIKCFRSPGKAFKTNLANQPLEPIDVVDGTLRVNLGEAELVAITIYW